MEWFRVKEGEEEVEEEGRRRRGTVLIKNIVGMSFGD